MPSYTTEALVLQRRNAGENDRILTLLTRQHGKLSASAKGASKAGSRLSGATEPFTRVRLLLATGRSTDIISQCEIVRSYPVLRTDIGRIARASYWCELLASLLHDRDATETEAVFDLAAAALNLLEREAVWPDAPLHGAELRLLEITGYAPVLHQCAICGASLSTEDASGFSPALGGTLCHTHAPQEPGALVLTAQCIALLQTIETAGASTLCSIAPPQGVRNAVNRALREFVRYHLGRSMGSADFLESIRGTEA